MRCVVSRFAAITVAIAYTGCASHDDGGGPAGTSSVLQVPTLAGGSEPVWIYAATPTEPGPHPVVIYGHGQGAENIVNCTPDRAPDDGDARTGEQIADALAARGYLAIALFYRNRGEGIPAIGELRARDHYISTRARSSRPRTSRTISSAVTRAPR
jgi:dienelactone hydrolase